MPNISFVVSKTMLSTKEDPNQSALYDAVCISRETRTTVYEIKSLPDGRELAFINNRHADALPNTPAAKNVMEAVAILRPTITEYFVAVAAKDEPTRRVIWWKIKEATEEM